MPRILVTPRSLSLDPPAELDLLTRAGFDLVFPSPGKLPSESELLRLIPGCVGWLAGVEAVSEKVIAAGGSLRAISRNGTGVDNLPLDALARRGIAVLKADGANAAGVAELTIGLMIAALRDIPSADAGIKAGSWPRKRGLEIRGRTIGVIGCGAIGRQVATVLAAMGAGIVAYDPFRPAFEIGGSFAWREIDEIFAEAAIVTLHCPPTACGKPIVTAGRLAAMSRGSVVVNTARASLVDEDAVRASLDAGHLRAYATDVFEEEPPKPGSLADHPHAIATSHIGGFTDESVAKATLISVQNLLAVLTPEVVA